MFLELVNGFLLSCLHGPSTSLRSGTLETTGTFWSHPLTFEGEGFALLRTSATAAITTLPLRGRRAWDPASGTLHPAFQEIVDSWWPDPAQPRGHGAILHFIPRDVAECRDSPWGTRTSIAQAQGKPKDRSCLSVASGPSVRSGVRPARRFPLVLFFVTWSLLGLDSHGHGASSLAWACLWCYLTASGSPLRWSHHSDDVWEASADDICSLQAALHSCWWDQPLPTQLPASFPVSYRCAWQRYPVWGSGVPDELFIATDSSGLGDGASAFVAWAYHRTGWYRVGWFADALPNLPWAQLPPNAGPGRLSFHSELVALQTAGLWVTALIDHWALFTSTQPRKITIAVDNSAALQVAAGHANPFDSAARWCRACWQAAQARCSTHFRHVHRHQGIFVNTIVDALAGAATKGLKSRYGCWPDLSRAVTQLEVDGPWLWLVPQAGMRDGKPVFRMRAASPQTPDVSTVPADTPAQLHAVGADAVTVPDCLEAGATTARCAGLYKAA